MLALRLHIELPKRPAPGLVDRKQGELHAMAINTQELQGQWNQLRGQVKQKWGQLTDDDLQIQGGNVDQLVGRIQQRTGEGREAIEKYLTELTSRGASSISQATEAVSGLAQQAGERLREGYGQVADRFPRRLRQGPGPGPAQPRPVGRRRVRRGHRRRADRGIGAAVTLSRTAALHSCPESIPVDEGVTLMVRLAITFADPGAGGRGPRLRQPRGRSRVNRENPPVRVPGPGRALLHHGSEGRR